MKIRNGFVSNSSSSSFIIFGKFEDGYSSLDEYCEGDEQWKEDFTSDDEFMKKYEKAMDKGYQFKEIMIEYGCEETIFMLLNEFGLEIDYHDREM